MKKTTIAVAALALSASSSFAIIGPGHDRYVTKTYCLGTYSYGDGSMNAGTCDETNNNAMLNLPRMENGCAEGQMALTTSKRVREANFPIQIRPCLDPNIVQL